MKTKSFLIHAFFWFFGVTTCAYYTAVTLSGCAQSPYLLALFCPLVLIPIGNILVLIAALNSSGINRQTLAFLGTVNGLAIIISALLLLVLSPLCILAVIGMVCGIMWLPIPLICLFYLSVATGPFVTSFFLRRRLRKMAAAGAKPPWLPISSCIAVSFACVLLAIFPLTITQACEAAVAQRTMLPQGLLLLRAIGDENVMLQACYGEHAHVPWFFEMARIQTVVNNTVHDHQVSETDARETFYRATGKPFNTVPRSRVKIPGSSWLLFDDGSWDYDYDYDYYSYLAYGDHDFAGETVGGVVRGLSLTGSTISGWVDPDEAVAHLSWKMNFQIADGQGKEIRAQILLPPHAVATGCSLFINGVRHECVIATRQSSRHAYTRSAESGEKPLLVSTAGAGRVLLQSSTGSWGKDAELVLDMTAPLVLVRADKAALPLPIFTERNFAVETKHKVSLDSPRTAETAVASLSYSRDKKQISGDIDNAKLADGSGTLVFERNPAVADLTAPDSDDTSRVVVQRVRSAKLSDITPMVVVIDGSAPMSGSMNAICDALQKAQLKDATVIWASDQPITVVSHASTQSSEWSQAISKLRDSSCLGGQNNAEALAKVIKDFDQKSDANIVWLHAGQPVKFTGDSLLNLLDKARHKLALYEYQVVPGPNEVVKSLDQSGALIQVPRIASITGDLESLLNRLAGHDLSYNIEREYADQNQASTPVANHPRELAQLCVNDLVLANVSNAAERKTYGTMAEVHHLVTPMTSALVLEDNTAYARYGVKKHSQSGSNTFASFGGLGGLSSAAGGVIPAKPEPPMSLIMACALLMMAICLWIVRKRRNA